MTIYLEDEKGFFEEHQVIWESIQAVIQTGLKQEGVTEAVEISLTVVGREEIQAINRTHRAIDRPTDVLSFPQIEPQPEGGIDWKSEAVLENVNLDTKEIMLGDIVLCEEVAKEQAIQYGHSLEREVCFLIAHSLFHLLGYDHMTKAEEKQMFAKQESVLQELNITR